MILSQSRIVTALAIALIALATSGPARAFEWLSSADEAFEAAAAEQKPVMMYLYHPFSLREDAPIFSNALVQRYSDRFVAVQINIDSKGETAERFGVSAFPAVLFFDAQERELLAFRYEGEKLKRTLLAQRMKRAIESVEEFALLESQKERLADNPNFLFRYAKGLRDRGQFKEADSYFGRLFEADGIDAALRDKAEVAFLQMLILQATQHFYAKRYDPCIEILQRLVEKANREVIVYQSRYLLGLAYWEAGDKSRGQKELKALARDNDAGVYQSMSQRYLEDHS